MNSFLDNTFVLKLSNALDETADFFSNEFKIESFSSNRWWKVECFDKCPD